MQVNITALKSSEKVSNTSMRLVSMLKKLTPFNSISVETSSTAIPITPSTLTVARRLVRIPLNIMITPQIADNTIAFIIYILPCLWMFVYHFRQDHIYCRLRYFEHWFRIHTDCKYHNYQHHKRHLFI